MLTSIALIILFSLLFQHFFEKIGLPGLLGMMGVGIFLGPHGVSLISSEIMTTASDFKMLALIVILLRAGLALKKESISQLNIYAGTFGAIPCIIEMVTLTILSYFFLSLPWENAFLLSTIISPVSPAIVVSQMLELKNKWASTPLSSSHLPDLLIASTSIDNILAVTFFGVGLSVISNHTINFISFAKIPSSILLGIGIGLFVGITLVYYFKKYHLRDTKKILILIAVSILLHDMEKYLSFSSFLAIMSIGFVFLEKYSILADRLANKLSKIWIIAEIFLFVLIGAQLNIYLFDENIISIILILFIGLIGRSLGVFISLYNSDFSFKEKIFCSICYLPKASVQAALGAIPLSLGIFGGSTILLMSILSIIMTAPLGLILIRYSTNKIFTEKL